MDDNRISASSQELILNRVFRQLSPEKATMLVVFAQFLVEYPVSTDPNQFGDLSPAVASRGSGGSSPTPLSEQYPKPLGRVTYPPDVRSHPLSEDPTTRKKPRILPKILKFLLIATPFIGLILGFLLVLANR